MSNKNFPSEDLFYYLPKTTANNSTKTEVISTKQNKFLLQPKSFVFSRGNSTFDFLNDLNKDKFKYPKLKPPFLTKSKRSIKIHKNILNKIKNRKKIVNSLHKFKLSDNCEFFYKLNKTYLSDKNSLKKTNTMNIIFKDNENISNIDDKDDTETKTPYKKIFRNYTTSSNKSKKIINLKIHNINKNAKENFIQNKNKENTKKIEATNINFLYNQIFPKIFVDHNANYNVIDNKLNLFYAEDYKHFEKKLNLKNENLMKQGKKLRKMVLDQNYAINKLNKVKRIIGFIKGIADYSFPDFVLQKSRLKYNIMNLKKKKTEKFKLPYQVIKEEKNRINLIRSKSLGETILINNLKNINMLNNSL